MSSYLSQSDLLRVHCLKLWFHVMIRWSSEQVAFQIAQCLTTFPVLPESLLHGDLESHPVVHHGVHHLGVLLVCAFKFQLAMHPSSRLVHHFPETESCPAYGGVLVAYTMVQLHHTTLLVQIVDEEVVKDHRVLSRVLKVDIRSSKHRRGLDLEVIELLSAEQ